ncbi:Cysteine-rich membrane protein 2 [Spironucleus salmonicida]|uniref:Cysteine-rich membrane protein 2 n=1 Tax=Spironucleus salmonicida TaxID=348837 RepID=V6M1P5_9EUKA|nr:Cysteine-rich membrane protein 2 [Spironucleus salmonicida]|eukprot:EST47129.1 Cysteine-rich membrane protein 2 [Spironucleus salmonicida]
MDCSLAMFYNAKLDVCESCERMTLNGACNCSLNPNSPSLFENCTICSDAQTCTECLFGFQLVGTKCVENDCKNGSSAACLPGFFCDLEGSSAYACQSCVRMTPNCACNCTGALQANCQSCSGTACASCAKFASPKAGRCVIDQCQNSVSCAFGQFCKIEKEAENICQSCDKHTVGCRCGERCANCNSEGCLVCQEGSSLVGKVCLRKCSDGAGECIEGEFCSAGGVCELCVGCKTCDITACLSCANGQFLEGGVCQDCRFQDVPCECGALKNCLMCGNGVCVGCISGFRGGDSGCNSPICDHLADNFYCAAPGVSAVCGGDGQAEPCSCGRSQNCLTCREGSCSACLDGFHFEGAACVPSCADRVLGFFCAAREELSFCEQRQDGSVGQCFCGERLENCFKCGLNACAGCIGDFAIDKNGSCSECLSGYRAVNGVCVLGLQVGAIVGIVLGVLGLVGALVILIVVVMKKRAARGNGQDIQEELVVDSKYYSQFSEVSIASMIE